MNVSCWLTKGAHHATRLANCELGARAIPRMMATSWTGCGETQIGRKSRCNANNRSLRARARTSTASSCTATPTRTSSRTSASLAAHAQFTLSANTSSKFKSRTNRIPTWNSWRTSISSRQSISWYMKRASTKLQSNTTPERLRVIQIRLFTPRAVILCLSKKLTSSTMSPKVIVTI